MLAPDNHTFSSIRERRAVRRFSQREVSEDLIRELLDLANRAPSGFNLQPWHFIVVRNNALKKLLCHVAMDQRQVLEAPLTVVFAADPEAWRSPYDRVLVLGKSTGALTTERAERNRKSVSLCFTTGPFSSFGFLKRLIVILRRLKSPTPRVITSREEAAAYVSAQTMLAASTFMIAAKAAGLDTSPMEGFDEYRLKKLLSIPQQMHIPIIVALGYPIDTEYPPQSVRIPLEEKLSFDGWKKL